MPGAEQILHLISQYGYLFVLFGVMLESAGIPLPGETILLASGVLVQQGTFDLKYVLIFGILGAIAGDQIGYWTGRKGGRPFVLRWGQYVRITPERLGRAENFFARHGGKAVFLARFVAGLRVFGALTAGMSRMNWRTFTFYNVLGGMTWATAATLAGYLLGGSLGLIEQWVGRASLLLAATLVFVAILYPWRTVGSGIIRRKYGVPPRRSAADAFWFFFTPQPGSGSGGDSLPVRFMGSHSPPVWSSLASSPGPSAASPRMFWRGTHSYGWMFPYCVSSTLTPYPY